MRNPVWNAWLRVSDLALAVGRTASDAPIPTPKRVLVAIGGHIGDAVIATGAVADLASRIPGVEIGVLCSSWNRVVFDGHPRVARVHVVDHWRLDRSGRSLPTRWMTTRRMYRRALTELRGAGYGAAIDLASHYPNSSRLLHAAGIPTRVGYSSGGGGPLYTEALAWSPKGHVSDEHATLLDRLVPTDAHGTGKYALSPIPESARVRVAERLAAAGMVDRAYVAAHMGAGNPRKEWPLERWIATGTALVAAGRRVVLTGIGTAQREMAARFAAAVPGSVSVVDELTWDEFRAVLASARVVLSVDTVAMHVAAAHGTPCVALMTGMDRPDRWRPLGDRATVLTEPVACEPCYRSRGCSAMSCVRDISVDRVLAAAAPHLS